MGLLWYPNWRHVQTSKKFFKRAYAARQGKKSVGSLSHHVLALVHVVNQVELVAIVTSQLFFSQAVGNDAHHSASRLLGGRGHNAHQAAVATTINQLALVSAYPFTHSFCCLRECFKSAWA